MEGTVGFARCHLGSSPIQLAKIVTIERAGETTHQKAYMMPMREVEDELFRR